MNKGQKEAWIGLLLVVPAWAVSGQLPILAIYVEGIAVFVFAQSLATLFQYGRGGKGEES